MVDLNQVLESKIYVKENSALRFLSPKDYLQPFLNVIEESGIQNNSELICKVQNPVVNENEDGTKNISYPRVALDLKVRYPELEEFNQLYESQVGLIYALDIKPVIKIYRGIEVKSCTNLCVWGSSDIQLYDLTTNFTDVYKKIGEYVQSFLQRIKQYITNIHIMQDHSLSYQTLHTAMGHFLRLVGGGSAYSKIGTTTVVQASQMLFDPRSKYYIDNNNEMACDVWQVYGAFTQSLTDQKITLTDRPTKSAIVGKMLSEVLLDGELN